MLHFRARTKISIKNSDKRTTEPKKMTLYDLRKPGRKWGSGVWRRFRKNVITGFK